MRHFISRAAILLVIILNASSLLAQDVQFNKEPVLEFEQEKFEGRFCVMAIADAEASYFVIDQTQMPGEFERIYFLNLVYSDHKVVNIDPDIYDQQMWFKADPSFTENEIVCLMDEFKAKTIEKENLMSETEKSEWLSENNKFKNK